MNFEEYQPPIKGTTLMFWYILQIAVIYWITNFYISLNTHEPALDILMIAIFVAYVITWLLSRLLWLLGSAPFRANPLLSQQSRNYPRIKITHKVLATPRPEDGRH